VKILHVIETLDAGGAERVLVDIVNRAPSEYHHVVLCLREAGILKSSLGKNVSLKVLHKKKAWDFIFIFRFLKYIALNRPDLIHTHLFSGNLWGRLAALILRIPCVMSVQNFDDWIRGWRFGVERLLANVPLRTLGVTQAVLDYRQQSFSLKKEKMWVISNASSREPCLEEREKIRQGMAWKEDVFVVGCVARLVEQKNPEMFLDIAEKVMRRNDKIVFCWVGDGELLEKMRDRARQKKLKNLFFPGRRENPMPFHAAFDLYLCCSRREGFSLSLLEALQSRCLVLATEVVGNREVLENLSKELLFNHSDPAAAIAKIFYWFYHREEQKALAEKLCREVSREHSVKKMIQNYHALYLKVSHS
jgi:glycosyltransferase involved in cell wall biosynthesis